MGASLKSLIAENNEVAVKVKASVNDGRRPGVTESALDRVCRIWSELLPDRCLLAHSGSIELQNSKLNLSYNAVSASDGEKAIFYNIGQVLLTPDNSVILIDEPELHMHKSIVTNMWDLIEASRKDCAFIYLMYDLDFARLRLSSKKYVIEDYDGSKWTLSKIEHDGPIPEDTHLQILSVRQPVLFVEGSVSSIDFSLYGKVYPKLTVQPAGGCEDVIQAVRHYRKSEELHYLDCRGIIDRDGRDAERVQTLRKQDVFVIEFSEIENILLHCVVLHGVMRHLGFSRDERHRMFQNVRDAVLARLSRDKHRVALKYVKRKISEHARILQTRSGNIDELCSDYEAAVQQSKPRDIYYGRLADIDQILASGDYDGALRLYENKGLPDEARRIARSSR